MTDPDPFDPRDRSSYRHWASETVRFFDTDALGHVNNNAFGLFFESARLAFYRDAGFPLERRPRIATVIGRIAIDFLAELRWPATLAVGTRMSRVGTKSFTYRQAVFTDEGCHAVAETVSVCFDLETRRSVDIPELLRPLLLAQL